MALNDPRLASIRAALEDVPLAELRKAAAHLPPQLAGVLTGLADALDGGTLDDEVLTRLVGGHDQADVLVRSLGAVNQALQARTAALRERVAAMRRQLDGLAEHRGALHKGFGQLEGLAAGDADLAALLAQAAATVSDEGPWQASAALLQRTERLVARLADLDPLLHADDRTGQALGSEAAALEQAAQALQAATKPMLEALPGLLDQATDLALTRDHGAAPAIALQAARVWEVRAGLAHADAIARWSKAFGAALKHDVLPAAWVAGKRLQAAALPNQDFGRVAAIAHQVADLAYRQGARPQAVIARLEEAQCLARLPDHRDSARVCAHDALAIADKGQDTALQAQARLMFGQAMELLDDPSAAVEAYQRALMDARAGGELGVGHGRIALHLGRIQSTQDPTDPAWEHLSLAVDLGVAHTDPSLLSAALQPAVDLALARGSDLDAGAVLRAVVQVLLKSGAEGELLARATALWGQERVGRWLKGSVD